ncbi:hypothetical protein pb186bvf_007653 [Paramecium bursaria]
MNILKCNSYEIKDFIYLINKVFKKGKGITQVSERLYKQPKQKQQKEQNKEENKEENKEVKPDQIKKPKKEIPQKNINNQQEIKNEIQNEAKIENKKQNKLYVQINKNLPQTYFQTIAWTMKQLNIFDQMQKVLRKQRQFYMNQIENWQDVQKLKEIILQARDTIEQSQDLRIKIWSYLKIKNNLDSIRKTLDPILELLGKIPLPTNDIIQINFQDFIQSLSERIKGLDGLIDALIYFQDSYTLQDSFDTILLVQLNYPQYIVNYFGVLYEIKQKYNYLESELNKFNDQEQEIKIMNQLNDLNPYQFANELIIDQCTPTTEFKHFIQSWFDRIQSYKTQINEQQNYSEQVIKLINIKETIIMLLINIFRILESGGNYNKSRIIKLIYIKQVKYFQKFTTNIIVLQGVALKMYELQKQLQINKRFVSSINLAILPDKEINTKVVIEQQNKQTIEIKRQKYNPFQKQRDLIKQIEFQNKFIKYFIEKIPKKGKLNEEFLNEVDIQLQKLQKPSIQKDYNLTKETKIQVINQQVKVQTDILGQMIYILEDLRFQQFLQSLNQSYESIKSNYLSVINKSGIVRLQEVNRLVQTNNKVQDIINNLKVDLKQYLQDPLNKNYLTQQQQDDFIIKLKKIDLYAFTINLALKYSDIQEYYQEFSLQYVLNKYKLPDLKFNNLKQYLIQGQKIFEEAYNHYQKSADQLIIIQWNSSFDNKIICSKSKRDDLVKLYKKVTNCTLLKFETARILFNKLAKQIFYKNKLIKLELINMRRKIKKLLDSELKLDQNQYHHYQQYLQLQAKSLYEIIYNELNYNYLNCLLYQSCLTQDQKLFIHQYSQLNVNFQLPQIEFITQDQRRLWQLELIKQLIHQNTYDYESLKGDIEFQIQIIMDMQDTQRKSQFLSEYMKINQEIQQQNAESEQINLQTEKVDFQQDELKIKEFNTIILKFIDPNFIVETSRSNQLIQINILNEDYEIKISNINPRPRIIQIFLTKIPQSYIFNGETYQVPQLNKLNLDKLLVYQYNRKTEQSIFCKLVNQVNDF